MRYLTTVRTYEEDDPEFLGDALEVRLFVDGVQVLSGDRYHDKIDDRIAGFEAALKHLGIEYIQEILERTQ